MGSSSSWQLSLNSPSCCNILNNFSKVKFYSKIFRKVTKVWNFSKSALRTMDIKSLSSTISPNAYREAQNSKFWWRNDSSFSPPLKLSVCNYPWRCKSWLKLLDSYTCYNFFLASLTLVNSQTWSCTSPEMSSKMIISTLFLFWSNLVWS